MTASAGPLGERRRRRPGDAENDARYANLVEHSPDAILVHDGERIITANAAALALAGALRREELVGKPVSLLLDPPYLRGAQLKLVGAAAPDVYTAPTRDRLRRLDGSIADVEVRAVVFLDQGLPAAHLVIRDISQRLALEETARQIELRVQHAERVEAVGALAGGVAHELNNMLAIILGHAAFWLEDASANDAVMHDVRQITIAAERAAAITRQLLAFSRHAVNRPEVVNLAAAVRDAEPALRRALGDSRTLVLQLEASPNARVDAGQLVQVLLQLTANARDATGDGGQLVVSTRAVTTSATIAAAAGAAIPAGRYGTIVLRDDGEGITPDVLPRIFEPFFTTKAVGAGTGLGLAAVQGILAQNSGFITVTSEVGAGAEFTMYLPEVNADDGTPLVKEVASSPAEALARRSVLLVEDEPELRAVAARLLEAHGLYVMSAADGVEAVELIERDGPPEVVLTDLRMPRMGGIDLQRVLKARWPKVQVLLMSGYSAEYLKLDGTLDDSDLLLQKPYTAATLMEHLRIAMALTPAGGMPAVVSRPR